MGKVECVILAGFEIGDTEECRPLPSHFFNAFYYVPASGSYDEYQWIKINQIYDASGEIRAPPLDVHMERISEIDRDDEQVEFRRKVYCFLTNAKARLMDTHRTEVSSMASALGQYQTLFTDKHDGGTWLLYTQTCVYLVIPKIGDTTRYQGFATTAANIGIFEFENNPTLGDVYKTVTYRFAPDMRAVHTTPKIAKFDVCSCFCDIVERFDKKFIRQLKQVGRSLDLFPFQEEMMQWAIEREVKGMTITHTLECGDMSIKHKSATRGGAIIASPGTGKTRWAAAMVLMDRVMKKQGGTLYVCPSHLVSSIASALQKYLPGIDVDSNSATFLERLRVCVISYEAYDLEVAKYCTFERLEYASSTCYHDVQVAPTGPIRRIIFDEFHETLGVKRSGLKAMRIISAPSEFVWFVSGTPRFSLMHALTLLRDPTPLCLREVVNSRAFWEDMCFREDCDEMSENLEKRGMQLSPIKYHIHWSLLSNTERALYDALPEFFRSAPTNVDPRSGDAEGPSMPLLAYARTKKKSSLGRMLLHFCSSVALLFKKNSDAVTDVKNTLAPAMGLGFRVVVSQGSRTLANLIKAQVDSPTAKWLRNFYDTLRAVDPDSQTECLICLDAVPVSDMWAIDPCAHQFCRGCIHGLDISKGCPQCRGKIDGRVSIMDIKERIEPHAKRQKVQSRETGPQEVYGAKIDKLIALLREIDRLSERALIRVNTAADVNILHAILTEQKFSVLPLRTKDVANALTLFNADVVRHLIMTKTSGLDLQKANHEILFAPSEKYLTQRSMALMEDTQFFARCQRIGQTHPVHVHVLLTQDTIEQEIYQAMMHDDLFQGNLSRFIIPSEFEPALPRASSVASSSRAVLPGSEDVYPPDSDNASDYVSGDFVLIDGHLVYVG